MFVLDSSVVLVIIFFVCVDIEAEYDSGCMRDGMDTT